MFQNKYGMKVVIIKYINDDGIRFIQFKDVQGVVSTMTDTAFYSKYSLVK